MGCFVRKNVLFNEYLIPLCGKRTGLYLEWSNLVSK